MAGEIDTSVEATEAAILPRLREAHADPDRCGGLDKVPDEVNTPVDQKSEAQWAYERLILYIKNFEEQLDSEHEVAMGFTGGDAGVLRIEGIGYFDPDIVTFYGTDDNGARTQMIQHVSQLNVMLRAVAKPTERQEATRIGFRLAEQLDQD